MDLALPATARLPSVLLTAVLCLECGTGPALSSLRGISPCSPQADADLLSSDALQCWMQASGRLWRTLDRTEAHGMLLVQIELRDSRSEPEVAKRFVDQLGPLYTEILLYFTHANPQDTSISRMRWTQGTGFDTLVFGEPSSSEPAPQ